MIISSTEYTENNISLFVETDPCVSAGVVYHYIIISDYGADIFSGSLEELRDLITEAKE